MSVKKESLFKNYIFQFAYQGLILVIPFILSPYLTRTLQETALGVYTYVNSIAYYFVIAANLGISVHGKRIISRNFNDETGLRKAFWSLYFVHALISIVSLIMYLGFVFCLIKTDRTIYLIEGIYVLSALFDITWLFYGLENFSSVVIKNAVVKVVECIAIFALVKSPKDLWIYTLVSAGGMCLGQVVMIPQAIKLVKPIRFDLKDCMQHFKPLMIFSVALIASSLYTVFDKTLLGIMASKSDVAFYEFSNKIVSIPQTFVGVVGTVMFPRACKLAAEGKVIEQKKYINISAIVTAFIGMGAIFGLLAVAPLFAKLYYGNTFAICGEVIIALSPTIYIVGAGSILRTQCLIPNGMDKQFNLCIVYNAIINLIVSTSLIPFLGIYGAVIGTLCAELFGLIYQMFLCRKFIDIRETYSSLIPFALIGLIMYLCMQFVGNHLNQDWKGLLILIAAGGTIYSSLSLVYLFLFKREILRFILKKVRK